MLKEYTSGEHKEESYYGRYDTHFSPLQDKKLRLLEIGIQSGGSLRMWSKYFQNADIYGIDIDPHCADYVIDRTEIHIGDQKDVRFLERFSGMDIIIDDGGHTMSQQQVTFETLFPTMNAGGIYVIEDLHTSYWTEFQDDKPTTEFLNNLVAEMNFTARISTRSSNRTQYVQKYKISEIHFYESMCFIYK